MGTLASGAVVSAVPDLRFTLMVPVVMIAIAFYATLFKVPDTAQRSNERVDGIGFLGLAIGMIALLSGLKAAEANGFDSPITIGTLAGAVVVLAVWVWWERRVTEPAVDVRLIASRTLGPVYLTGFLFGMIMFGIQAPLTVFLSTNPAEAGYGFAANTGLTSAVVASVMVMATLGAGFFARIARKIGVRSLLLLAVSLAAAASLFVMFFHSELWQMFAYAALLGAGVGLLLGALPSVVSEMAPPGQTAVATGVYNSLLSLGGATAGALFAVVLGRFTVEGSEFASVQGYQTIWGIGVGVFVLSFGALSFAKLPTRVEEEVTLPESDILDEV